MLRSEGHLDIPRKVDRKNRTYLYAGVAAALVATTLGLGRLRPAAPTAERGTLWIDTVKRGPMLRQVRGAGTLQPEQIRWISALTAGRIERILARPGTRVEPSTVLMELSNPDVQLEALDADRQLNLAQSNLASLDATLQNGVLSQQGTVAEVHTEFQEAKRAAAVAQKLAGESLNSAMDVDRAKDKADEMATRFDNERKRLEVLEGAMKTQLELERAQVERLQAIARFHQGRVASMRVTAGDKGVLQEMSLEVGQWVNPGALLAKVAQPERLKAVLRIPETQAKDVALGQSAVIDTRNGTVPGRVVRIDPASQDGTVGVDVALGGALPQGARPDLSVDGVIEIERLADVLFVGRPAFGDANSTVGMFRLQDGGDEAARVSVRLGRSSVNTIEVIQGLRAGDQVILSDMSRWDTVDRVRLK